MQHLRLVKEETGVPYGTLCRAASLPYRNLMRWKQRVDSGEPVMEKAGPKKVVKPDMAQLQAVIGSEVRHQGQRSFGAGQIYRQYREQVSRRDLQHLVELTRREQRAERLQRMRRIRWNTPGIVLALDDLEYDRNPDDSRLFLHNELDLASRFCFPPVASADGVLDGEAIAYLLTEKFEHCAPPLFLKRDNGSNLNHSAVDSVLSKFMVLPLNSPTRYPPYNGSVERLQREIKDGLRERLSERAQIEVWMLEDAAGNVVHNLNHKRRKLLSGRTACDAYSEQEGGEYSLRQRERILELLNGMVADIMAAMNETGQKTREAAWRMAVETWLHNKEHITVSINGKVLPYFLRFLCHN